MRNANELIESCGKQRELRREAVRAMREGGATEAEIVQAFDDGWMIEDGEWHTAVGSREALLKGIKADEDGCVSELDLGGYGSQLAALPAPVGRLTSLTYLDLYGCSGLTCLPAEVGGLTSLTKLDLRGWGLDTSPSPRDVRSNRGWRLHL